MPRCLFRMLFFFLIFITPKHTFAAYEKYVVNEKTTVIENENCKATNSCSLKRARFHVLQQKYRFEQSEPFVFGTTMYAWLETDTVSALEDYVFVQFIRGCRFESRLSGGTTEVTYSKFKNHFGELVRFKHPDWVIDSMDRDPAYSSWPGQARHYSYFWT